LRGLPVLLQTCGNGVCWLRMTLVRELGCYSCLRVTRAIDSVVRCTESTRYIKEDCEKHELPDVPEVWSETEEVRGWTIEKKSYVKYDNQRVSGSQNWWDDLKQYKTWNIRAESESWSSFLELWETFSRSNESSGSQVIVPLNIRTKVLSEIFLWQQG